MKKKEGCRIRITEKGRAILLAIECGLCPEVEGGYNDEAFDLFWELYMKKLHKKILWRKTLISLFALMVSVIALLNSL